MIARFWSARATEPLSREYLDHYKSAVLPELSKLDGYLGSTVMTRPADGQVEIVVATLWQSLESIKQFAGSDFEAAVVAEVAAALLADYDRRVRHFDVAIADASRLAS